MAHAIEMYFDDQADAAVRDMWQVLADAGQAGIKDTATGAITLLTG